MLQVQNMTRTYDESAGPIHVRPCVNTSLSFGAALTVIIDLRLGWSPCPGLNLNLDATDIELSKAVESEASLECTSFLLTIELGIPTIGDFHLQGNI